MRLHLGLQNRHQHPLVWMNIGDIYSKQYMEQLTIVMATRLIVEYRNWRRCRSLELDAKRPMHVSVLAYFYMAPYHSDEAKNRPVFSKEEQAKNIKV